MATKVPFVAGDYLIFRPKVDRWVDFTQCDYGGLIADFTSISVLNGIEKYSNATIDTFTWGLLS